MSRQIFRQAALERLSTPEQLDQVMRVTTPTSWLSIFSVIGLVVGAVVWSIVGTVPVKVEGAGILISPGGVLDVISSSDGRITEFLVKPGDHLEFGDVIARVDQPDLRQELDTARAELTEQLDQHTQIEEFHQRELEVETAVLSQRRNNLKQRIAFLTERLKWLRERESFENDLLKKGLINRQRYIDTKIEINSVREELSTTRHNLKEVTLEENTIKIAKEREILDSELALSALSRKVDNLTEQLERMSYLQSPYKGRVVEFKVNVGEIVSNGLSLFSLLPDDSDTGLSSDVAEVANLIGVLYISPADGKKVQPGMKVEIAPSTVKREEFGFMMGRVRAVSEIPSTAPGMMRILKNQKLVDTLSGDGAPFQVLVDLLPDAETPTGFEWSSSRGPEGEINTGTLCDSTVTVREIRLISLVIPALEQLFAPSVPL
jgi:HlyD family secretion protein